MIDFAHYTAQMIWVIANAAWAGAELYTPDLDDPFPLRPAAGAYPTALQTGRWWAAVLLVCAFVPIVLLYVLCSRFLFLLCCLCMMSLPVSLIHPSVAACLHSPTPHDV